MDRAKFGGAEEMTPVSLRATTIFRREEGVKRPFLEALAGDEIVGAGAAGKSEGDGGRAAEQCTSKRTSHRISSCEIVADWGDSVGGLLNQGEV